MLCQIEKILLVTDQSYVASIRLVYVSLMSYLIIPELT